MARIILLEDDTDIREVVQWILESENYEVFGFVNVADFMDRDLNLVPDLYILDVMLPDGSGLDVCSHIRNESRDAQVPIIIMSAHASLEQVSSGCVADAFIQKPFDVDSLLKKVNELVN
ncbi:response regulator [Pedobacter psychrodurus]|uniref:Response regulator n=1 Tax=Pedobacter psychrodurus TaxID=2530456 RepID=A0A4R0PV59_9SPHI|nr:response regulator [Pedobacter psychrodurus]TCD25467.1 response regulator [Pedobacter psychrodurus]